MKAAIATHIRILGTLVAIMWILAFVNSLFGRSLLQYGIRPRTLNGLWGILVSPFLHVGWQHLISNTVPFIILGWLVLLRSTEDFWLVTAVAMGVGGLGTWLFAGSRTSMSEPAA